MRNWQSSTPGCSSTLDIVPDSRNSTMVFTERTPCRSKIHGWFVRPSRTVRFIYSSVMNESKQMWGKHQTLKPPIRPTKCTSSIANFRNDHHWEERSYTLMHMNGEFCPWMIWLSFFSTKAISFGGSNWVFEDPRCQDSQAHTGDTP